ncbi:MULTISPECIES: MaoC family dehydratase N-terminal domain-containing protein [unclassified Pseudonocardia]|uniref:MaoC family dehydratase N-terminal domain-containing protein n=1 Tax=unclassified Pseudonocardia TaxID=2619320 RepID=UPI0001FFE6A7|nr:MaoC family dehydratase N-terminal domain-containing protein [Pseudonocardia sp. Ae707_Ps1]OLM08944.1 hypothetical protein Ae707Ps1_5891 [Pseudonocardia sp. Ae707_Ps1]
MPRSAAGITQPAIVTDIERGQLRSFAHAIGETDPIYVDVESARKAGHPDLPAPLTFLFGAGLDRRNGFGWLADLGIDLRLVLHGSQRFCYHSIAYAGQVLHFVPKVVDSYEKKGGTLRFLVRETIVTRADGSAVADLQETVAVREIET